MEYKVEYENPKLQYYILRIIYILIILSAVLFIEEEKYIIYNYCLYTNFIIRRCYLFKYHKK